MSGPGDDAVDEAAKLLRASISVTEVAQQNALTVLCEEIERLRAVVAAQSTESAP